MKSKILLVLGCLLAIIQVSVSQTISQPGKTPVSGISQERVSKLDAMLEEAIQKEQVPGLVAMVVKNGQVVYHSAKGFADV